MSRALILSAELSQRGHLLDTRNLPHSRQQADRQRVSDRDAAGHVQPVGVRLGYGLFDAGIQALQEPEQEEGARDLQQHQERAALLA